MGAHQTLHGDGVKDIAFSVEDCRALYKVRRLLTYIGYIIIIIIKMKNLVGPPLILHNI